MDRKAGEYDMKIALRAAASRDVVLGIVASVSRRCQ
jgi:hypothetical protein